MNDGQTKRKENKIKETNIMASRLGTIVQKGVVLTLFGMTIGGAGLFVGGLVSFQKHKVRLSVRQHAFVTRVV